MSLSLNMGKNIWPSDKRQNKHIHILHVCVSVMVLQCHVFEALNLLSVANRIIQHIQALLLLVKNLIAKVGAPKYTHFWTRPESHAHKTCTVVKKFGI